MRCYTQEEIAEEEGIARETVRDLIAEFGDFGNLADSAKAVANHLVDFKAPRYNVWK